MNELREQNGWEEWMASFVTSGMYNIDKLNLYHCQDKQGTTFLITSNPKDVVGSLSEIHKRV